MGCSVWVVCLLVCGWGDLVVDFVVYLLLIVGLVRLVVLVALLLLIVLVCYTLVLVIGLCYYIGARLVLCLRFAWDWLAHVVVVCGLVTYGCCVFVRLFVLVVFGWVGFDILVAYCYGV